MGLEGSLVKSVTARPKAPQAMRRSQNQGK
jgi:hypothetical protein